MLEQIGLYDEAMPGMTNFEDTDEAYRAHKAGWKILINFGSVVYHHYHFTRCDPGVTNHLSDYHWNLRYCRAKHGPEFEEFCEELGRWMDAAYGKAEA
jgi:GT2 family glycosyltransferase